MARETVVRCDRCGGMIGPYASLNISGPLVADWLLAKGSPNLDLCPSCFSSLDSWLTSGAPKPAAEPAQPPAPPVHEEPSEPLNV